MTAAWGVRELRDALTRGEISAEAVCRAVLDRLPRVDAKLNAFVTVAREQALEAARQIDRQRTAGGRLGPLAGVPIAVKDNIDTAGLRTTAGSRLLDRFVPPFDATAVARLREAGAIVVGKTNCDEFAMGSSNENSAFGPVRNPWALDRTPGGSSGGSAAAVAARLVPAALGSDTGGSVRQPAAMCGVVGLKPTYGRVSRYGLIAFGSSLDQIGPIARTVEDAALLLDVVAGPDPRDATASSRGGPDATAALNREALDGVTLAVPRRLLGEGVDPDVARAFDEALHALTTLGARLLEVELPHARYAIPVYYLVATAEASSNLARYDGVRYTWRAPLGSGEGLDAMYRRTRDLGFGAEVKRRILLGTYVLSAGYHDAYYLKAQQVRTLIRRDYETCLMSADAVVLPTSPTPAFRLGERLGDPLQMYLADVFTVSANLAGLPALSVPCGFTPEHLPVGLQLVGRAFEESTLVAIGHAYQRATTWHRVAPPVCADDP